MNLGYTMNDRRLARKQGSPFAQLPRKIAAHLQPWQLELYERAFAEAKAEVARTQHTRRLWSRSLN